MKTCPICNCQLDSEVEFCTRCGWEFRVYLILLSGDVEKQERQRRENALKCWKNQNEIVPKCLESSGTSTEIKAILLIPRESPRVSFPLKMGINNLGSMKMTPVDGVQHIIFTRPRDISVSKHQLDIRLAYNSDNELEMQIRNIDQSHRLNVNQLPVGGTWTSLDNASVIEIEKYSFTVLKL